MRDLLRTFASVPLALAAYNAGPARVRGVRLRPAIPETQSYVADILGLLHGAGDPSGDGVGGLEVRLVRSAPPAALGSRRAPSSPMGRWVPSVPDQEVSPCPHRSDGRPGVDPRSTEADPQLPAVGEDRAGLHLRARRTGGRRRRGGHHPAEQGPARGVVEDQRPGVDRLVRRLGDGRRPAALALTSRPGTSRTTSCSRRASSGWRPRRPTRTRRQPTSFIESEGTSLKAALDIARKFGAVRDSVLPFASGALFGGDTQTFYALASQLKILTYFNLGTTIGNWKTWLATKGPILTRLDVDTTWDAATDNKGNMDEYDADHHPRRALRGHRRLQEGPLHRPQQLGHQLGRQGLRATRRWTTRRRPSPRPTASRSDGPAAPSARVRRPASPTGSSPPSAVTRSGGLAGRWPSVQRTRSSARAGPKIAGSASFHTRAALRARPRGVEDAVDRAARGLVGALHRGQVGVACARSPRRGRGSARWSPPRAGRPTSRRC